TNRWTPQPEVCAPARCRRASRPLLSSSRIDADCRSHSVRLRRLESLPVDSSPTDTQSQSEKCGGEHRCGCAGLRPALRSIVAEIGEVARAFPDDGAARVPDQSFVVEAFDVAVEEGGVRAITRLVFLIAIDTRHR